MAVSPQLVSAMDKGPSLTTALINVMHPATQQGYYMITCLLKTVIKV